MKRCAIIPAILLIASGALNCNALRGSTSIANKSTDTENNNGNSNSRNLQESNSKIAIPIHPFTITIGPTPDQLLPAEIDHVGNTIETLLTLKLQVAISDADADAFTFFNNVESVELSDAPEEYEFTESEVLDEWRTRMGFSTLTFRGGIAQLPDSASASESASSSSLKELNDLVLEILNQDLLSYWKEQEQSNGIANDLEWLTMLKVDMSVPPTNPPTLSPTVSPTDSPTKESTRLPTVGVTVATPVPVTGAPTEGEDEGGDGYNGGVDGTRTDAPTLNPTKSPTRPPQESSPQDPPDDDNENDNETQDEDETQNDDYPFDDDGSDIPAGASVTMPAIVGGISAAGFSLIVAALFLRRRDRRNGAGNNHRGSGPGSDRCVPLCNTDENHDREMNLKNMHMHAGVGIKHSNGYESSGRDRDADGDSTQTPDTVEGQDTPPRPNSKHNDNFVDAPHSPTPSRGYDIANLKTGEVFTPPRSPGPQQPQLRSKDSAEILKDLEWFGSLPGQSNPCLYFPVKGVNLNADSQANDDISEYTNTSLPFQDHPIHNPDNDNVGGDITPSSSQSPTAVHREESFELTKSMDMNPIIKGALCSCTDVIPTRSVYDRKATKERKSCLEPTEFTATSLLETIEEPDLDVDADRTIGKSDKDALLDEDTPLSDSEECPPSPTNRRRLQKEKRSPTRSRTRNSRSRSQRRRRNTSVGGSEASESDGGDVSEFLLDTSWDPDDADEASALFDEPQFEPMYAPEFKHDPFMADDERDSFS